MAQRARRRILVVNPNSNEVVTQGLAAALEPVAFKDGPAIDCMTLTEGPYDIETQEHVESVALPLRRLVTKHSDVDAFVPVIDPTQAAVAMAIGAVQFA